MKKTLIFLLLLTCCNLAASAQKADKEAIKKVIQTAYVDGLQNEADSAKINSGIHPDFLLLGIGKKGEMWNYPIDKWTADVLKRKEKGGYPKTGDKKVSVRFKNIDITGTAAVAKIEFYVGKQRKYVDYIALYKFESGWKMVNKIFYKFEK